MSGLYAGLDAGSATTKAVLLDGSRRVAGSAITKTGVRFQAAAERALGDALAAAGAESGDIEALVSTGYGRDNYPGATATRTEIGCHGRGAFHFFPYACTVIDIGGQDNKVIHLDADGRILRHRMNRKCAAGTGSFIEEMALKVGVEPAAMDGLGRAAAGDLQLNSFCTVFAGTEVIAMARRGESVEEIVRAAYNAIVARVIEMAPLEGDLVVTGGVVAHHPIVLDLLSKRVGATVRTTPMPQETGAVGAALIAQDLATGSR